MSALSVFHKISETLEKKVEAIKPHPLVLFDIGSATIGVAVVEFPKRKAPIVHFTHRERIQFGDEEDPKSLGSYVSSAIVKAASSALGALGRIEGHQGDYTTHAIVHAPWTDSLSRRAEKNLKNETLITKEFLKQFIAEQLPPEQHQGRVQFDRHTIRIELNGYPTRNPYEKHAENIAVTVLESSMATEVHEAITTAFKDTLPNHETHLDAFLFATTQMHKIFGEADAYTIVDISGEYTSVSVVRDQTIIGTEWAKFGTEHLVRTVGGNEPEARINAISELTMFLNDTCTPAQCRKIESLLEKAEKEWSRSFGDACAKLSKAHRVPTTTFVSVDNRFGVWFEKGLARLDFGQFTVTGQPLNPTLITADILPKPVQFLDAVKKDSMLALGITFVDK